MREEERKEGTMGRRGRKEQGDHIKMREGEDQVETTDAMMSDQRQPTRSRLGSPELLSLDNVPSLEEECRLCGLLWSGRTETVGWNWARKRSMCVSLTNRGRCAACLGPGTLRTGLRI